MYALLDLKNAIRTQRTRLNNFGVLLLANAFTAGFGFITTISIANAIGSVRFGELAYAIAIGGIIAANIRFGMDRSLLRELIHYPDQFNEILAASLLTRILLLTLCTIILLIFIRVINQQLEITLGIFLIVLAIALRQLEISSAFDAWEEQGKYAIYYSVERAIYFLSIWFILLSEEKNLDLVWIGCTLLFSVIIFLILQYIYALKKLKPTSISTRLHEIAQKAYSIVQASRLLWIASLGILGMTAINKIILKQSVGFSELGIYAAALQLIGIGVILVKNIARIGKPILTKTTAPNKARLKPTISVLTIYIVLTLSCAAVVAFPAVVVPEWILSTIFISEYSEGSWVLRLLGIYLIVYVLDTIMGQFIVSLRQDKSYLFTTVAAGSVGVCASLMLAPHYGAVGAATALLLAEIVIVLIYSYITIGQLRNFK